MKRPYYIMTSGWLRRKDNTIYFEPLPRSAGDGEDAQESFTDPAIDEDILAGFTDETEADPKSNRVVRKPIPVIALQ